MLKQRLQQKLLQKLSPQQIQMIKLLEIPTMQLEQRIKKELEDNPVLEEGSVEDNMYREEEEENQDNVGGEQDEFTFEDYLNEEDIPSYRLMARNYSKDDRKENIPFSVGITFHDFLESQLGLRSLTEQQQILAQYILGNIDDDGYLRRSIDSIVDDIAFSQNITTKVEELAEILKLNPKPGSSYSDPQNKTSDSIVPDFILENNDGELQLSLNSKNVPELKISKEYLEMLKSYHLNRKGASREQKEAMTFVRQKLDSAKWFIDAIRQRQNTLLLTMHAIINFQSDYFQEGEESKLKPMILKDIADVTGLDISTVSRVANSKYIQTTFGIFPLRYFFSEGMQTDSGEEVSTREIKKILEECINNEDKRKPLTDEKLGAILNKKGYPVARRTVAKYREQLNIPVARMRKEL